MGKTAAVTAASYFEYRHQSRHPLTFDLSSNLPAAAASASPPFRSWPTALQLTNPLSLLAESLLSTNERQEKKIDKWQHRFRHSCRCLRQFVDFPTPKKRVSNLGLLLSRNESASRRSLSQSFAALICNTLKKIDFDRTLT